MWQNTQMQPAPLARGIQTARPELGLHTLDHQAQGWSGRTDTLVHQVQQCNSSHPEDTAGPAVACTCFE